MQPTTFRTKVSPALKINTKVLNALLHLAAAAVTLVAVVVVVVVGGSSGGGGGRGGGMGVCVDVGGGGMVVVGAVVVVGGVVGVVGGAAEADGVMKFMIISFLLPSLLLPLFIFRLIFMPRNHFSQIRLTLALPFLSFFATFDIPGKLSLQRKKLEERQTNQCLLSLLHFSRPRDHHELQYESICHQGTIHDVIIKMHSFNLYLLKLLCM